MLLNHLDLPSQALEADAAFLCQYFEFSILANHCERIVLKDSGDFILILNQTDPLPKSTELHLGFLLTESASVISLYKELQAANTLIPVALQNDEHQCLFYCQSPGGLTIEVAQRRARQVS